LGGTNAVHTKSNSDDGIKGVELCVIVYISTIITEHTYKMITVTYISILHKYDYNNHSPQSTQLSQTISILHKYDYNDIITDKTNQDVLFQFYISTIITVNPLGHSTAYILNFNST